MYGKTFKAMYEGSMLGAGWPIFAVWNYAIAKAVKSYVELNPRLIALVIGCEEVPIGKAIEELQKPDPESRCQDHEGRRLVREGQFLYFIPSWEKYHRVRSEEDRREYQRNWARKKKAKGKTTVAPDGPGDNGRLLPPTKRELEGAEALIGVQKGGVTG